VPRRTHPPRFIAALVTGLLLALGVAACGGGSQSAGTLETPPLTVGTGATLPSSASTSTTTTTTTSTTSTTPDVTDDTGGAVDTGADTGAATGDTGDGDTGDTGADTGGGTAPATGGGDTTTPAEPANPGGAAPNYQSFCDENPGAC
jgi:hypothetical protein